VYEILLQTIKAAEAHIMLAIYQDHITAPSARSPRRWFRRSLPGM